jgi:hypothetical protein
MKMIVKHGVSEQDRDSSLFPIPALNLRLQEKSIEFDNFKDTLQNLLKP